MRRSAREATAYHEAGHAVAAALRRVPFKYVTVEQDEERGSTGHTMFTGRSPKSLEDHFARGVVTLAGEAAQRRFNPRTVRRHHGGGDRKTVVDLALQVCHSGEEATLLAKLWDIQAQSLVKACSASVDEVAQALLERSRLTQEEVLQLAMVAPQKARAAA